MKRNIIEALQDKNNAMRISFYYRWLVGDGYGGWIVYEAKRYAKKSTVVIETKDEAEAVSALLDSER